MKILVPVDGSECSLRAVDYLISHLSWFREQPEVHMIYVHPPVTTYRTAAWVTKETLDRMLDEESEHALAPGRERLTNAAMPITVIKKLGDIADEIVRYAKDNGCTLIVMGTHGHGALGNLVLGSVSNKVLAQTTIPVLLVR